MHIAYENILEGGYAKGRGLPTGEGAEGGELAVRLVPPEECGCASYSKYGTVQIHHSAVNTSAAKAAYAYPKDPVAFVKALKTKLRSLQDA